MEKVCYQRGYQLWLEKREKHTLIVTIVAIVILFGTNCTYFLLQNQSLDLTLSDYPVGNPEYVQTTPAGHIPFGL